MTAELAERYYRLALSKAAKRDLSGAARFARYACELDENNKNAARLLELCMCELGEGGDSDTEVIAKIRFLAQRKQWHKAMYWAKTIKHRNVRVLNIQGCLYACMRRYKLAARLFAQALEKDRGNKLAARGLVEVTRRARFGVAYEKPL